MTKPSYLAPMPSPDDGSWRISALIDSLFAVSPIHGVRLWSEETHRWLIVPPADSEPVIVTLQQERHTSTLH